MIYIYVILSIGLAALIYMMFEAGFVKLERVEFTKNSDCLKVLQLSDIHIPLFRVSPQKVKTLIEKEKPDLIVITGDYITKPSHIPAFLKFLEYISVADNRTFLCFGNHDYKAIKNDPALFSRLVEAVESKGVTALVNTSVCFQKGSRKYNIIGIEDIKYKHHDIKKALASCCSDASSNIAISHNPDIVLELPRDKVDYLFSGHFHGGQIWAPFNLEFRVLRKEKLCKMGIRRGLHKVNGINLYINRGLGNVTFPLRLFSRPEITVFHIP